MRGVLPLKLMMPLRPPRLVPTPPAPPHAPPASSGVVDLTVAFSVDPVANHVTPL